jgi:hypothetical protein
MKHTTSIISTLLLASSLISGCSDRQTEVSFKNDVMPILNRNCMECHAEGAKGEAETGLGLYSYDALMKGTKFGPIVIPGNSLTSVLNQVVEGRVDKSIQMPHGRTLLNSDEVATLNNWVEQGAKDN